MFNYHEFEQAAERYDERLRQAQEEHLGRELSGRQQQTQARGWMTQTVRLACEGLMINLSWRSQASNC
jgi:hypothetical protein